MVVKKLPITSAAPTTQQILGKSINGNWIKPGNFTTMNILSVEQIEILTRSSNDISFYSSKGTRVDVEKDVSNISDETEIYDSLTFVPSTPTTEKTMLKFQVMCSPSRDEETESRLNGKLTSHRNINKDLSDALDSMGPLESHSPQTKDRSNITQMTIIKLQGNDGFNMSEEIKFTNSSNIFLNSMKDRRQDSNLFKQDLDALFQGSQQQIVKGPILPIGNPIIMARNRPNSISGDGKKHDNYGQNDVLAEEENASSFFQLNEKDNANHDSLSHSNKHRNVSDLDQSRQNGNVQDQNKRLKSTESRKEQQLRGREENRLPDIFSFYEYGSFEEHKGYNRKDGETYFDQYIKHQNLTKDYKNDKESNQSLNLFSFLELRPVQNKELTRIEFSEPTSQQIMRLDYEKKRQKEGTNEKNLSMLEKFYGYERTNSSNIDKLRNANIQLDTIKNFQANVDGHQHKHHDRSNDSSSSQSVSKYQGLNRSDVMTIGKCI